MTLPCLGALPFFLVQEARSYTVMGLGSEGEFLLSSWEHSPSCVLRLRGGRATLTGWTVLLLSVATCFSLGTFFIKLLIPFMKIPFTQSCFIKGNNTVLVIYCCITNNPQILAAWNNSHMVPHNVCGSGIWAWNGSSAIIVLCFRTSHKAAIKVSTRLGRIFSKLTCVIVGLIHSLLALAWRLLSVTLWAFPSWPWASSKPVSDILLPLPLQIS